MTFTWNTSDWSEGNYTIEAEVDIVTNEADFSDNTLVDGWVVVTIQSDVNGDFRCEGKDNGAEAKAYDTRPGDLLWNPNADINGDLVVEGKDAGIVAKYYDTHYP